MPMTLNSWRSIAIGTSTIALLSLSPYSLSQRAPDEPGGNGGDAGNGGGGVAGQLDEIIARLDRIEQVVGCPADAFMDGTCEHSPVGTTVSFCISQGRGLELSGGWGVEAKAELQAGARWDVAALGDAHAGLEFPLAVGPIPIPTEAKIGGSAGIGRGLDICIDVPLEAAEIDEERLAALVAAVNTAPFALDRSKFQRRLLRAIRFAEQRAPTPLTAAFSAGARVADDDELDRIDDAVDRFMAGDFSVSSNGPLGLLKDPIVADLRSSLDLPAPLDDLLADPDSLFGNLPAVSDPALVCDTIGVEGPIAQRYPAMAELCDRLASLPSYEEVSTAFETVHEINALLADLPDEIIFGVGDILPDVEEAKLPTPRPPGSRVCAVFPRLCR